MVFRHVKFYHRVLDLAKTAPQEAVTDEVSLLLAIKVCRKENRNTYRKKGYKPGEK